MNWASHSTQHLHEAIQSGATWGYVIYRTTYTHQSDTAFPQFVNHLNACIKDELFSTPLSPKDNSSAPNTHDKIWATYRPVIMAHQAQFDQASLASIRSHFESWVDSLERQNGPSLYHTCLVCDEESLQAFLSGRLSSEKPSHQPIPFLKVLKAHQRSEEFDGFLGADYSDDLFEKRGDEILHHNGLKHVEDSDSDEYDGFLGG